MTAPRLGYAESTPFKGGEDLNRLSNESIAALEKILSGKVR